MPPPSRRRSRNEGHLIDADPDPGGLSASRVYSSKALLHVSRLIQETREAKTGAFLQEPKIDLAQLRQWKPASLANSPAASPTGPCSRRDAARAWGKIVGEPVGRSPRFQASRGHPADVEFDTLDIATGSLPTVPPMFRINDPRVMDSTGRFELAEVPNTAGCRRRLASAWRWVGLCRRVQGDRGRDDGWFVARL